MHDCAFDQRHQLRLVTGKSSRDIGCTELHRQHHHVDRGIPIGCPFLALAAPVRGRRKLAFGQAVDTIVLDNVNHVYTAPDAVRKLSKPDRTEHFFVDFINAIEFPNAIGYHSQPESTNDQGTQPAW